MTVYGGLFEDGPAYPQHQRLHRQSAASNAAMKRIPTACRPRTGIWRAGPASCRGSGLEYGKETLRQRPRGAHAASNICASREFAQKALARSDLPISARPRLRKPGFPDGKRGGCNGLFEREKGAFGRHLKRFGLFTN